MVTQETGKRRIGSATASLAVAAGSLALLAVKQRIYTAVAAQVRAYTALVAERHHRMALNHQHRVHFDLLCKAMDDPALAAVLDTYEDEVPPEVQRQYLFANALYVNALHAHRIGAMTRGELYGHLRMMCQNQTFRSYWEATRPHRASLADSSEEAALGRMMDTLVRELAEADGDEWWVVGEPPAD